MPEDVITTTRIGSHGAARLPSVNVDSFNIELKDDDHFVGDRATKGAFRKIFDRWRKPAEMQGFGTFSRPSTASSETKGFPRRCPF